MAWFCGYAGPYFNGAVHSFSALINLVMGSASAKWTTIGPRICPDVHVAGNSPELTQAAYRIGDSCTNLITPLMAYFSMIVVFAKKYDHSSGIGTIISTMIPYSLFFLLGWSVLLIIWMLLGLPLDRAQASCSKCRLIPAYSAFIIKKKRSDAKWNQARY